MASMNGLQDSVIGRPYKQDVGGSSPSLPTNPTKPTAYDDSSQESGLAGPATPAGALNTPMTDAQALFKAQRIWGPVVTVCHDVNFGKLARECYMVLAWDTNDRCEVVASVYSYASSNDKPVSWEALFASVQAGAQ
jgi:hypothetical protein